jgi:hypothetical protein
MAVLNVRVVTGGLVETGVPVVTAEDMAETAGVMVATAVAMTGGAEVTGGPAAMTGVPVVIAGVMTGVPEVTGVRMTGAQVTAVRVTGVTEVIAFGRNTQIPRIAGLRTPNPIPSAMI